MPSPALTCCLNFSQPSKAMHALVSGLAEVHLEFVLIHPFREGNGRIARLLMDVMACQAGIGPLDYSAWDQDRETYFGAIRAGAVMNSVPMEEQIRQVLPGWPADR
ncbi:MAG: Fic family protein [Cyanobium sp.]